MKTTFLVLVFFFGISASILAEITGPVVGYVRLQVGKGPQRIEPSVRPRTPADYETNGQVLSDYLGDEFRTGDDATEADWVGFECANDQPTDVSMIWKDQQDQWLDLLDNSVEPECTDASVFWVDLVFDEATDGETRELILSGEAVW